MEKKVLNMLLGWHNGGCLWDKIASEWAGAKKGVKKEKCLNAVDTEGCRDLRNDECEALGRTQAHNLREYQTEQRK